MSLLNIGLETITIPVGTILYRGVDTAENPQLLFPENFRSPIWFGQTKETAAEYARPQGIIGEYRLIKPLTLMVMNRENALKLVYWSKRFSGESESEQYYDRVVRIQRMMALLPSRDIDQKVLNNLLYCYQEINNDSLNLKSRLRYHDPKSNLAKLAQLDQKYEDFVKRKKSLKNREEELKFLETIKHVQMNPEDWIDEYSGKLIPGGTIHETIQSLFQFRSDGTFSRASGKWADDQLVKWLCSNFSIQGWVGPEFYYENGIRELCEEIMLCKASKDKFELVSLTKKYFTYENKGTIIQCTPHYKNIPFLSSSDHQIKVETIHQTSSEDDQTSSDDDSPSSQPSRKRKR